MADEETLQQVREAFDRVRGESDLGGWVLDDRFLSPFSQEVHATELTISLVRGESEHTSIVVDPVSVARSEGEVTVPALAREIRRALRGRGILSD